MTANAASSFTAETDAWLRARQSGTLLYSAAFNITQQFTVHLRLIRCVASLAVERGDARIKTADENGQASGHRCVTRPQPSVHGRRNY